MGGRIRISVLNLGCGREMFKLDVGLYNNMTVKKIKKICETCGKEFEVYPSYEKKCNKKGHKIRYCSISCYDRKGEKNPMYGKKHTKESIKKMVDHPNRPQFERGGNNPNYLKWKESFEEIKRQAKILHDKGKNDVEIAEKLGVGKNWVGKWRKKNGLKINRNMSVGFRRKKIINKIGKCMECGYSEEIRILQLHHIDRNRKNNKKENCLLLCPNCHELIHYKERTGRYGQIKES